MEKAKKGKKTAKPKKGTKGKKKGKNNGSMNFFSKIMLALLFISVITIAVFLIAANFKTDNTDKAKIEISLDSKKDLKKEENLKLLNQLERFMINYYDAKRKKIALMKVVRSPQFAAAIKQECKKGRFKPRNILRSIFGKKERVPKRLKNV